MKLKETKRVTKELEFYTKRFNFHKPFRILLDATLCQAAIDNKVYLADAIPRYLLGADLVFVTTQCIISETEQLLFGAPKLKGCLQVLREYKIHKCGHEEIPQTATKCIKTMLNNYNENHFFVATQDTELIKKLNHIPCVPVLHLVNKTPHLMPPSKKTIFRSKQLMRKMEKHERSNIQKLKKEFGVRENNVEFKKRKRKKKEAKKRLKQKQKQVHDSKEMRTEKKRSRIKLSKHVKEELLKNIISENSEL